MKKLLLTTVLAVATIVAMANPIDRTAAMQKAKSFMQGINPQAQLQTPATPRKAMGNPAQQPYYIFNAENNQGFVIVSGDDRSEEILGYSDEGFIDVDNMPDGLQFFLDDFAEQLAGLDAAGITEPASTSTASRGPRKVMSTDRHPVAPLTTSKWTQGQPYNLLLPVRTKGSKKGQRAYSGCSTIAMAQMIYFWKYAYMRYNLPSYVAPASSDAFEGTIDGLPKKTFDFSQIKNSYSSSSTDTIIANFIKYIFVATKAYPGTSGTYCSMSTASSNISKYFNYTIDEVNRKDMKPTVFEDKTYNDLRQGIPVMYYGKANNGEHCFVVDGYSHDGFFHINWGWAALCDGYFRIAPLSAHNYGTAHAYARETIAFFGFRPNDGRVMPGSGKAYESFETAETFCAGIRTLSFTEGENSTQIYTSQTGTQRDDGTYDFGDIRFRAYLENRTDLEGGTETFDTEFVILDKDDNIIGTFGSQEIAIGRNSVKAAFYDPNTLRLPSGDGEYYLVHRNKSQRGEIFHYSEIKGVYSHIKAVVSGNKLTLSLIKALQFDSSKTELTGQCATGWRTNVRFYAKNNAYVNMKNNYTLYLDGTSSNADNMQDSKELNIPARSSGYIDLDFTPGENNGKLYLANKDRDYSSDYVDATYSFTLKTAVTPNLSYSWTAENLVPNYTKRVYGNELNGYVSITNNGDSDYEDFFTLMIYVGSAAYSGANKYVCSANPLKIPAGETVKIDFDGLDYSDLFDIYGSGLGNKKVVSLTLCNGKGVSSSAIVSEIQYTMYTAPIKWWDKNGRVHAVGSLTSNRVPDDAVAISFISTSSIPSTITPNNNPNCLYYFPSSTTKYYTRLTNYSLKNVIAGTSAVTSIKFTDGGRVFVPITFTAANVSYTRTFDYGYENNNDNMGWTSICLPFTVEKIVNKAQNRVIDFFRSADDVGKNFWLRKLFGEEFNTLYFDCASEFKANVPYLIRMPGEYFQEFGDMWCLTGKQIEFSAQNTEVVSGMANDDCATYNFIGTETAAKYNADYYIYGLEEPGNVFTYLSSTVANYNDLKPFRGYLTREYAITNESQNQVKIVQRSPLNIYDYYGRPEDTKHRFPAIEFAYANQPYEMPAWDEVVETELAHTRLQALNEINNDNATVPVRTVTSRGWSSLSNPTFIKMFNADESITIGTTVKAVGSLTYGEACDILNLEIANADRNVKVFDFYGSTANELTVPSQLVVTEGVNAGHTLVVNEIGTGTYCNNSALKEVFIPASITTIKNAVFAGCIALNKVTFESEDAPVLDGDPFASIGNGADVTRAKCAIYVPAKMVSTYRNSNELWNDFIFASPVSASYKFVSFCSDVPFTTKRFNGTRWITASNIFMYWIDMNKNNSSTTLTLSPTRDSEYSTIPAGFGLVMKTSSEGGSGYIFMPPVGAVEKSDLIADNNRLKGVTVDTEMDPIISANPDYKYFALTNNQFRPIGKENTLSAGRAYLEMPASIFGGESKVVFTLVDDVTDGILLINGDEQNVGNIYDIQGRKVENATKGIYIVNGKKFVIK